MRAIRAQEPSGTKTVPSSLEKRNGEGLKVISNLEGDH